MNLALLKILTINTIVPRFIPQFINTIIPRFIPQFINTIVLASYHNLSILLSSLHTTIYQYYCPSLYTTRRRIQAIASEHISSVLADIRLVQIEELTKAIDGQKKVGRKNILMRKKGEIELTNLTALPIFTSYLILVLFILRELAKTYPG